MFHTNYDAATRTWYGQPSTPNFHPNVSIAQILLASLRRRPNHVGQINADNGVRLTNRSIRLNAIRAAEHLALLGIDSGDVIGIAAKNHHYVSAIVVAAMALGAPLNTLDPNFKCDEIVHMLRLTKPKVLFCDSDNIDCVREALAVLDCVVPIFTFDRKVDGARLVDDLLHETGTEHTFLPTVLEDGTRHTAAIVCSSGTTGSPKGVSLSHAMLLEQMSKVLSIEHDDILLSFSSLYWISGLISVLAGTLFSITRVVTTMPFSAPAMLRCVQKYGITVTLTAPTHVSQLLQHGNLLAETDLSTLRRFYVAGGALSFDQAQRLNAYLPADLRQVYGMSEVAGKISCNTAETAADPRVSVGLLVDGIRVRILRDDGEDEADGSEDDLRCDIDEDGEICVQLRPAFTGYWNNDEATAAAFTADGEWFRTGDIGHFDASGRLYVVDRKKDLLKYNNVQVSPSELEAVITKLMGVAAVCVVGIPDEICGDLPAAVVVRAANAELAEADVREIVEARMNNAKWLRGGVFFIDQLPTTHSGKVMRRVVREMAESMFNERRLAEMQDA